MKAREINDTIRYTMWSVFRATKPLEDVAEDVADGALRAVERGTRDSARHHNEDFEIRGWYDVSGLRADADLMVWWHAASSDTLQDAYHALRRSDLGRGLQPVWSQLALHRPAEFNKSHIPAYLAGEDPKRFVCVYPFVRSFEWYLLPDTERREMLAEHGRMARDYPDVRANTVASFALGDYEWMLAFEADELHRIVDLMRHLRGAKARLHTREEIPFYTGARKPVAELVATLP